MSTTEFDNWCAYFEIEPPLPQLMETMLAQLCQTTIAVTGAKQVPDLDKFMPMVQAARRATRSKRNSVAEFVEHLSKTGKVRHGRQ